MPNKPDIVYFDSHTHLDDEQFECDRHEVIMRAYERGVHYMVNIGSDIKSSKNSLCLAEKYPFIYAACGVHPHDAKCAGVNGEKLDTVLRDVKSMASKEKCVAIGEIGLDYHYDFSPRDTQKMVFRAQMQLAKEMGKKVIIHEREAARDTLDILADFPEVTGVVHCFSGSVETAKILLNMGYMMSFTGVLTYKNARHAPDVVKFLPEDKIMAETDSPYLTAVPYRGKRSESAYVELVVEKMAQLRGVSKEQMAKITTQNAIAFYGIK